MAHVNKKFGQASFISNCFIFISFQLYIKDGSYHRNQPQIKGYMWNILYLDQPF